MKKFKIGDIVTPTDGDYGKLVVKVLAEGEYKDVFKGIVLYDTSKCNYKTDDIMDTWSTICFDIYKEYSEQPTITKDTEDLLNLLDKLENKYNET